MTGCDKNGVSHDPGKLSLEELKKIDYFDLSELDNIPDYKMGLNMQEVVVANRGSGTISVIDPETDNVVNTISLPAGTHFPEPMYVVIQPFSKRVFVGDRANNRITVFSNHDFQPDTTINVGNGVFHMWSDFFGKQLWVVNDVDKTLSVINTHTLENLATVPIPADLAARNGFPHDVIVSASGYLAYVSVFGVDGPNDFIIQYYTPDFTEIGRAAVGKEAHLSMNYADDYLYVPCQLSNKTFIIDRFSMKVTDSAETPGAHGAGMLLKGGIFYTTNAPGGGYQGIHILETKSRTVIGSVDTPFPVPHNISLSLGGLKLYVTHSGPASDKVSVYEMDHDSKLPYFIKEITVGSNPYGISHVFWDGTS